MPVCTRISCTHAQCSWSRTRHAEPQTHPLLFQARPRHATPAVSSGMAGPYFLRPSTYCVRQDSRRTKTFAYAQVSTSSKSASLAPSLTRGCAQQLRVRTLCQPPPRTLHLPLAGAAGPPRTTWSARARELHESARCAACGTVESTLAQGPGGGRTERRGRRSRCSRRSSLHPA